MQSLPIQGGFPEVSVYMDDTIERVRELIAIAVNSHPDRLFIQVRETLPDGTYATPKEWSELFLRLSRDDGRTVSEGVLRLYLDTIRPGVSDFPVKEYSREEWDDVDPAAPIRREGGSEWRILGAKAQPVLPLPPKDVDLPASQMPILSLQSLLETMHKNGIGEVRVTPLPDAPSEAVLRVYFPRLQPKQTPVNLDMQKAEILRSHAMLGNLLSLPGIRHHRSAVLNKAKWYIPLNATKITNPRMTFEQIFYGLTLSKTTPFIGYYTAGESVLRSKVYVEDPKTKIPFLDRSLVKAWYSVSAPNRRRPTLLLYRGGTSRNVFQRIAITSVDITIDIRKEKGSTKTVEDLREEAEEWLLSLDAVVPFLDARDLTPDRWTLGNMSLLATYATEETEFDMLRFDCLRTLFSEEGGTFRLLRTDQGKVPRRQLEACQALTQDDVSPTPESLANAMGISVEEAKPLLDPILSGDVDCEQAIREFPEIRFTGNQVEIDFVTNPERVLTYVDILRHVLTLPPEHDGYGICNRRGESVPALGAVPQNLVDEEDDDEGFDISEFTVAAANAAAPSPAPAAPKSRTVRVAKDKVNTQNYFNTLLQDVNADLFKSPYSKECEKNNQVVVLTPETKETMKTVLRDASYSYVTTPEGKEPTVTIPKDEALDIPGGTAICPPYWCMRDLIPLREEDLVSEEGTLRCPVCKGKVRPNDSVSTKEYPVIKRESSRGQISKYPRFMRKGTGPPCCYPTKGKTPAPGKEKQETHRTDENYILGETFFNLPKKRAGRISDDLATRLGLTTSYDTTIVNKRLDYDAEDIFRIGLGPHPEEVLREVLKDTTSTVPDPIDPAGTRVIRQCSFYATTRSTDVIPELNRRWVEKTMDPLDQIEYLSFFLDFSTILVDATTNTVQCGFQVDSSRQSTARLVLFTYADSPPELLAALRRKKKSARTAEVTYSVNLAEPKSRLSTMSKTLVDLHQSACQGDMPRLSTAVAALKVLRLPLAGDEGVEAIVDADGDLQYLFVKNRVLLPFVPVPMTMASFVPSAAPRRLHELPETDLPTYDQQVTAMNATQNPMFFHNPARNHRNAEGFIVDIETKTGFRIPVQPRVPDDPSPKPVTEVLETIRTAPGGDETLLSGPPDSEGIAFKSSLDYRTEVYEFLLMSLANDIAVDASGETRTDFPALRTAIETRNAAGLKRELAAWFKQQSYKDSTATSAYEFLSKVRTPCGQLSKDKETCEASPLCGWVKPRKAPAVCKIRVRSSQVDADSLLTQIQRTLVENDKQWALVLDNRVSRFFSTMLYQELPHELFLTI